MSPSWTVDRFEELFRGAAPRVRSYLRRHVETDAVDDVLAETFIVAWQRIDRVPESPMPWLLTTARHMARRHHRSRRRADTLWQAAVHDQWRDTDDSPEDGLIRRADAIAALAECSRLEREALLLTAWDGLTAAEAAGVAGCSTRAFTVRLSRARARFDRAVSPSPPRPSGPFSPTPTVLVAVKEPS